MQSQPKIFFGMVATVATIYVYKNYDTLPSVNDIKVKLISLYPSNKTITDLSNSDNNDNNDNSTFRKKLTDMSNNDHV